MGRGFAIGLVTGLALMGQLKRGEPEAVGMDKAAPGAGGGVAGRRGESGAGVGGVDHRGEEFDGRAA